MRRVHRCCLPVWPPAIMMRVGIARGSSPSTSCHRRCLLNSRLARIPTLLRARLPCLPICHLRLCLLRPWPWDDACHAQLAAVGLQLLQQHGVHRVGARGLIRAGRARARGGSGSAICAF